MLPMAGRTAGPIKTNLGIGTHVDPGSVLVKVKVKVIYLCVRYNRIHACDTWRITMYHARISRIISRSSSAVAAGTWCMLIKLITEARKGRENSSAKRDSFSAEGRVLTDSRYTSIMHLANVTYIHGVGVITKLYLYFVIFAQFKESLTLNLAQGSFKVTNFDTNRKRVCIFLLCGQ